MEEHEKLVQGIINEMKIRARLDQLSFYIKIGLTNYSDIEEYQKSETQKQELFQRKQKKSISQFAYDDKRVSSRSNPSRRKKISQGVAAFNKVFALPENDLFQKKKKSTFIEKVNFRLVTFLGNRLLSRV